MTSLGFWRALAMICGGIVILQSLVLFDVIERPSFIPARNTAQSHSKVDQFEEFEGIAFAREFSERYLTFDPRSFKVSQIATAFLLDSDSRAKRIADIERIEEKILRGNVSQRARLMNLERKSGVADRYRAELELELQEGVSSELSKSLFRTRLEFSLERAERSAQNPWGFRVAEIKQEVLNLPLSEEKTLEGDTAPIFFLRPKVAMLVRFPCAIENVELPKGGPVRVKLTTFDISELQIIAEKPIESELVLRTVCRDHEFTMRIRSETQPDASLVVLKSLKMSNSVAVASSILPRNKKTSKRKRTGIEKSIEEQLGFIVEEE